MKTLCTLLLLLTPLAILRAQTPQPLPIGPKLYFTLTDSSRVVGRIIRQDSATVVVELRGGVLTYLQPQQIARATLKAPQRTPRQQTELTTFSLKDGATVIGYVVNRTPVAVVVRQLNGSQTYIDPNDILQTAKTPVTVEPRETMPTGVLAAPYLLSNRTAYTPGGGQVYYRNTYLIRNELEAGLTDGWSVGAAINPLWTGLYDTSEYLADAMYANSEFGTQLYTRFGIPIGSKLQVGAGITALLQKPSFYPETRTSWLGQVLMSIGDPNASVTLNYAFELSDNVSFVAPANTLSVGASLRLNRSLTFVSDNTVRVRRSPSSQMARLSAALRIQSHVHSFDVGLLSTVTQSYFSYPTYRVYPYLGYIVRFGR
jgi:hypothetical protein